MSLIYSTERHDDLIVQIVADDLGEHSNPRGDDNVTEIFGSHRHYTIGDGEPPRDHMRILERGGIRLLARYMRRFGDPRDGSKILALCKLGMIDHSGISFYTVPLGSDPTSPFDYGGWDSGAVGYVIVTQKRWAEIMGDMDPDDMVEGKVKFPLGSVTTKVRHADLVIEQDVETYDDWARGNVWGYVISRACPDEHHEDDTDEQVARCPHSDVLESCFGYIGDPDDPYLAQEAEGMTTYIREHAESYA